MASPEARSSERPALRRGRKARGRVRRLPLVARDLQGRKYVKLLEGYLKDLRQHYAHPNRVLYFDDVVTVYLLAFFNPLLKSLRCIEDASELPGVNQYLSVQSVCRATLSDANALFDPALLAGLIQRLQADLSPAALAQGDLGALLAQVTVYDGSFFDLAADVAWAIRTTHQTREGQDAVTAQVRLDLHYCLATGVPEGLAIAGHADGGESQAAAGLPLEPGRILLADRGCFSYALLERLGSQQARAVLRVKANVGFDRREARPLSARDQHHQVQADHVGGFPSATGRLSASGGLWREVLVAHGSGSGESVRLITNLLDVEAWVLAELYRQRWQIELFFRFLKAQAHFRHLTSHAKRGVTLSFYVAWIALLLQVLYTQAPLSKYHYNLLALVGAGHGDLEDLLRIAAKRQRERALAKASLARRKARAKNP